MPEQARSTTAKVRKLCRQYLNEFGETPAGDLRCNFCDVLVKCVAQLASQKAKNIPELLYFGTKKYF